MRRVLAITLLIAFFAPFAAPLAALTSDPEANLPPCCRSHGTHHCAMMHWMLEQLDAKPRFTSAPCPLYPAAAAVPQLAVFTLGEAPRLSVESVDTPALPVASARRAQLFLARTRGDRGPPAHVA